VVALPAALFDALLQVAHHLARGDAVQVIPVHTELTTQQAADLLGVSRPHVVKLVEEGDLPFSKVGTHRRIRFDDLMTYKARRDAEREAALTRLTQSAEDLGLPY
jgi:excisionase family DNA binding protein